MTAWREDVTCWTPEEADRLIPVEAEALSDELFQATHVPLRLRRVPAERPYEPQGELVTERQVLDQLLRRLEPQSRANDIIPILGVSGAGKSHLVRWLRNELRFREDLTDVRFVFVPKHRTSLRGVITSVMSAFEDVAEISELRERLLSAREDKVSDAEFRTRIRDALANGLEFRPDRTEAVDEATAELRTYLAGSLPAILRDPHFGPRYTAEGGAIARLVEEKLRGRRGDDAIEEAFEFSSADVAIAVDDVSRAARAAQDIANHLASDPVMPDGKTLSGFAAQMLNDQLPAAIKEVFGIGSEDLRELFIDLRRILKGRQDIVLLVEDFAMFQGLQAGLVDAITVASSVTEELCHLITVVAVTTGYYDKSIPDTLKGRASAAFVVDAQGPDAAIRFAATYLRAMRLRTAKATDLNDAGSSCEGCQVVESCHSAFGSVDGEGLFPFNRVFLGRSVITRLGGKFNARQFLTQVLRTVMVEEHENVRSLHHPSEDLAEAFSARHFEPAGDALMRLRARDQGDRRARLALLYKNDVDEGDLSPTVHAAFGLPTLGLAAATTKCSETDCQRHATTGGRCVDHSQTTATSSPEPESLPSLVVAIDEWRRGSGISQGNLTTIRQLVTTAVFNRIEFHDAAYRPAAWNKSSLYPWFDTSGHARSIVIDGNRSARKGLVELELLSSDADTLDAFQSLAWLNHSHSWRDMPNGTDRSGRFDRLLSRWSSTVSEKLGLRAGIDSELAAAGVALEVVAGLAGGGPVPKLRSQRLVRLRSGDVAEHLRWPKAVDLVARFEDDRGLLAALLDRRLAYAQGPGAPAAYDAVLTRKLLSAMAEVEVHPEGCSGKVDEALKVLARRLGDVGTWGSELRAALPDLAVLGGEYPKVLIQELEKVARRGQVATETRRAARDAARAVQEDDVVLVEQARSELERWDELPLVDQAALAGGAWWGAAERLQTFISSVDRVITAAMPDSVRLDNSDRSRAESEWTAALHEIDAAAKRLREALR